MVGVLLILAFTSHVSYLTFVSFDYGYNMAANTTIGTVSFQLYFAGCDVSLSLLGFMFFASCNNCLSHFPTLPYVSISIS